MCPSLQLSESGDSGPQGPGISTRNLTLGKGKGWDPDTSQRRSLSPMALTDCRTDMGNGVYVERRGQPRAEPQPRLLRHP